MRDELKNARKQFILVKPSYNAFAERVLAKLAALIPEIKSRYRVARLWSNLTPQIKRSIFITMVVTNGAIR